MLLNFQQNWLCIRDLLYDTPTETTVVYSDAHHAQPGTDSTDSGRILGSTGSGREDITFYICPALLCCVSHCAD